MKRFMPIMLIIALILTVTACGGSSKELSSTVDSSVVTDEISFSVTESNTTLSSSDIVSDISGNNVSTSSTISSVPQSSVSYTSTSSVKVNSDTEINTSSVVISSSSTPKVVQLADPETGISWDGVSPIVYTYTDGSTGTSPQNGAKYEAAPGVTRVYLELNNVYDGKCDNCGKTQGDGTNGTCVIYRMLDNCSKCGATGVLNHCHTCGE